MGSLQLTGILGIAVESYRKAAEQGEATAQYELGFAYFNGEGVEQDRQEGFKWLRMAAEQGLANAQGMLGIAYAKGQGVPQNYVLAYMWLHLATEGRQGAAQFRDAVGERMTVAQISEAQKLAREWKVTRRR